MRILAPDGALDRTGSGNVVFAIDKSSERVRDQRSKAGGDLPRRAASTASRQLLPKSGTVAAEAHQTPPKREHMNGLGALEYKHSLMIFTLKPDHCSMRIVARMREDTDRD